jgi:hypothetical protein
MGNGLNDTQKSTVSRETEQARLNRGTLSEHFCVFFFFFFFFFFFSSSSSFYSNIDRTT